MDWKEDFLNKFMNEYFDVNRDELDLSKVVEYIDSLLTLAREEERKRIAGISCKYYPNRVVFTTKLAEGKLWEYLSDKWFDFIKEAGLDIEEEK